MRRTKISHFVLMSLISFKKDGRFFQFFCLLKISELEAMLTVFPTSHLQNSDWKSWKYRGKNEAELTCSSLVLSTFLVGLLQMASDFYSRIPLEFWLEKQLALLPWRPKLRFNSTLILKKKLHVHDLLFFAWNVFCIMEKSYSEVANMQYENTNANS